jgi:hypothetical protein
MPFDFWLSCASWLSYFSCPILAVLSGYPVLAVLHWLSCLDSPSWLSRTGSPVLVVLSWLAYPDCCGFLQISLLELSQS